MICKRCGEVFKNANSWGLCMDCFMWYEKQIPNHIAREQYPKYLLRKIEKELHEIK